MADCPHCKKEIDFDTLDKVMDLLAEGQVKASFVCKNVSCKKTIVAINSTGMYYIEAVSGDDEFIGAK